MVEGVAHDVLDDARGLDRHQAALVLALEFRLADEDRDHRGAAGHQVVGGDGGGALALADALGMVFQRPQQGEPEAAFVRAAVGRRDGVAVGMDETVVMGEPGHRPFERAMALGLVDPPDEKLSATCVLPSMSAAR